MSDAFRFTLQPALDTARAERDDLRERLQQAFAELAKARDRAALSKRIAREATQQVRAAFDELTSQTSAFTGATLGSRGHHLDAKQRDADRADAHRKAARAIVDALQRHADGLDQQLTASELRVQELERLEANQRAAFRRARQRVENTKLDNAAIDAFNAGTEGAPPDADPDARDGRLA
ncbi:MAG: hypothetical protein AAGK04_08335 [Planctomycetota bacterium]